MDRTESVSRNFRRNAAAVVGFDAVWSLGSPACNIYTVVPAYLLFLGVSKTVLQFITVSLTFLVVLQLWSGPLLGGLNRRRLLMVSWFIYPLTLFLFGLLGLAGWTLVPKGVWVVLMALAFICVAITIQLSVPAYAEMVLENTPMGWRGRLASLRSLGAGLFGIAGLFLAQHLMAGWDAPHNFHWCFIVGPLLMGLSCQSLWGFRDSGPVSVEPPLVPSTASAFNAAIGPVRGLLSHFTFRVFIVFLALLTMGHSLAPLLLGYGRDVLGMTVVDTNKFTAAYYAGAFFLGMAITLLADRFGFRLIAVIAALNLGIAFLAPILFPHSVWALLIAYALIISSMNLTSLVLANLGNELMPGNKTTTIIAASSLLVMPLNLITAPLGGRLVDVYGAAGYTAVFTGGVVLSLCAALGFLVVIREPRTGEEIVIRQRAI
jgi:MFS family permease